MDQKTRLIILLLICSTNLTQPALAKADPLSLTKKKTAVIVNLGDGENLGPALKRDQEKAKENYEKLGYNVIILSNDTEDKNKVATKQNFQKTISNLTGVTDLKIDIIGHGTVKEATSVPNEYKNRFPEIKLTVQEKKSGFLSQKELDEKRVWVGVSTHEDLTQYQKGSKEYNKRLFENSLGSNDVKHALQDFQSKNSNSTTTLHVLNCFGGNLGRDLQGMKNVQIFTAAEPSKVASEFPTNLGRPQKMGFDPSQYSNYYSDFHDQLKRSIETGNPASFKAIHEKTAQYMIESMIGDGHTHAVSSSQHYLQNWCILHPQGTNKPRKISNDQKCTSPSQTMGNPTKHINQENQQIVSNILTQAIAETNKTTSNLSADLGLTFQEQCKDKNLANEEQEEISAKKKAKEIFDGKKKALIPSILKNAEKRLDALNALYAVETESARAAKFKFNEFQKILFEANRSESLNSHKPFKSFDEVPKTHPSWTQLNTAWLEFIKHWDIQRRENKKLEAEESRIKKSILDQLKRTRDEMKATNHEDRSIKKIEEKIESTEKNFNILSLHQSLKDSYCIAGGPRCNKNELNEAKSRTHDTGSKKENEEDALFKTIEVSSVLDGYELEPEVMGLMMDCTFKPTPPKQMHPTEKPNNGSGLPGAGKPSSMRPPFISIGTKLERKISATDCVNQSKKPEELKYLYYSTESDGDLTSDCIRTKNQLDLYDSNLECGNRFAREADQASVDEFLESIKLGEKFP